MLKPPSPKMSKTSIRIALVVLMVMVSRESLGQEYKYWYPDGTPYKRPVKNSADILKDFDNLGRVKFVTPFCGKIQPDDCLTTVAYKLFSDKPMFVIAQTADDAILAVDTGYNYGEYLLSRIFILNLDEFIKKKALTDKYIKETMGQPDSIKRYSDGTVITEYWRYSDAEITFNFTNGLLISYVR